MRLLYGIFGVAIGLIFISVVPAPNWKLTSQANGYDVFSGQPHLVWKGGVQFLVVVVGAAAGYALGSARLRR